MALSRGGHSNTPEKRLFSINSGSTRTFSKFEHSPFLAVRVGIEHGGIEFRAHTGLLAIIHPATRLGFMALIEIHQSHCQSKVVERSSCAWHFDSLLVDVTFLVDRQDQEEVMSIPSSITACWSCWWFIVELGLKNLCPRALSYFTINRIYYSSSCCLQQAFLDGRFKHKFLSEFDEKAIYFINRSSFPLRCWDLRQHYCYEEHSQHNILYT